MSFANAIMTGLEFADRRKQREQQERQNFMNLERERQQAMFQDGRVINSFLKSGQPQQALNVLSNRLSMIEQLGGDPTDTMELAGYFERGDYQGATKLLDAFDEAGVMAGFIEPLAREKKPQVGRFKSQVLGNELVITDSATGDIISTRKAPQSKKEALEQKKLQAQVEKAESEAQIKALVAETGDQKKDASLQMATEAADLADRISGSENLSNIVGTIDAITPVFRTSSQDLINDALRLESLLTVDNLKLMSGVLTDRDIKFLTRVGSGLNISDTGIRGSESAVKNRLKEISKKLRSVSSAADTTDTKPVTNVQELSDDELFN